MESSNIQKSKEFIGSVIAVQFILLAIILFKNLKSMENAEISLRWVRIRGFPVYHLIGGILLVTFTVMLMIPAIKKNNWQNMVPFAGAIFFGGLMFFWSAYIDSTLSKTATHWTADTKLRHDPIWYILFAIFVFLFYISLEFQETEKTPLLRMTITIFGISPAIVAGLGSIMDGVNYVTGSNAISLLVGASILLLGLISASIFGLISYYKSLKKIVDEKLLHPAILQFIALLGLTEGLIIFAFTTVVNIGIEIEFPLVLFVFITTLVIVYSLNTNYISTLSTPLYELLIVNNNGITLFGHAFQNMETLNDQTAFLKGGVITALSSIFNEITGTEGKIDQVTLEDRTLIIEKISYQNEYWMVALIAERSCAYIRKSLRMLTVDVTDIILNQYAQKNFDNSRELPNSVHLLVEQYLY